MDSCQPGRVCSLGQDEMGDRAQAWKSLNQASLASRWRDEEGLTLVYRRSVQAERALDELVRLERICCGQGGMHFSVSRQKETLTLRVSLSETIQEEREVGKILNAFAAS